MRIISIGGLVPDEIIEPDREGSVSALQHHNLLHYVQDQSRKLID